MGERNESDPEEHDVSNTVKTLRTVITSQYLCVPYLGGGGLTRRPGRRHAIVRFLPFAAAEHHLPYLRRRKLLPDEQARGQNICQKSRVQGCWP